MVFFLYLFFASSSEFNVRIGETRIAFRINIGSRRGIVAATTSSCQMHRSTSTSITIAMVMAIAADTVPGSASKTRHCPSQFLPRDQGCRNLAHQVRIQYIDYITNQVLIQLSIYIHESIFLFIYFFRTGATKS